MEISKTMYDNRDIISVLTGLNKRMDAVEAEAGKVTDNTGEIQQAINDLRESLLDIETEIDTIFVGMSGTDGDIAEIRETLTGIDDELARLEEELNNVQIDAFTNYKSGTIKGSVNTGYVGAISDGTGRVNGWDDVYNTLEQEVSDLDSLTDRVTALETLNGNGPEFATGITVPYLETTEFYDISYEGTRYGMTAKANGTTSTTKDGMNFTITNIRYGSEEQYGYGTIEEDIEFTFSTKGYCPGVLVLNCVLGAVMFTEQEVTFEGTYNNGADTTVFTTIVSRPIVGSPYLDEDSVLTDTIQLLTVSVVSWTPGGSESTLMPFTNEALGLIRGSTVEGGVGATSGGLGVVNGWDELVAKVAELEPQSLEEDQKVTYDLHCSVTLTSSIGVEGIAYTVTTEQVAEPVGKYSITYDTAVLGDEVSAVIATMDLSLTGTIFPGWNGTMWFEGVAVSVDSDGQQLSTGKLVSGNITCNGTKLTATVYGAEVCSAEFGFSGTVYIYLSSVSLDKYSLFTDTTPGYIVGSSGDGEISSQSGRGAVNGWSDLKAKIAENESQITTLSSQSSLNTTNVSTLFERINSTDANLVTLNSQLGGITEKNDSQDESIESLRTRLNSYVELLNSVMSDVTTLTQNLTTITDIANTANTNATNALADSSVALSTASKANVTASNAASSIQELSGVTVHAAGSVFITYAYWDEVTYSFNIPNAELTGTYGYVTAIKIGSNAGVILSAISTMKQNGSGIDVTLLTTAPPGDCFIVLYFPGEYS